MVALSSMIILRSFRLQSSLSVTPTTKLLSNLLLVAASPNMKLITLQILTAIMQLKDKYPKPNAALIQCWNQAPIPPQLVVLKLAIFTAKGAQMEIFLQPSNSCQPDSSLPNTANVTRLAIRLLPLAFMKKCMIWWAKALASLWHAAQLITGRDYTLVLQPVWQLNVLTEEPHHTQLARSLGQ